MRRLFATAAVPTAALTLVALAALPQAASAWTGEAYADGSVLAHDGTGEASGTVDADPDGTLEVAAESDGGTGYLVPLLNLLPYSTPTTVDAQAYVSDGVDGLEEEAGHDYRVTVYYGDLDVEASAEGGGRTTTQVWAQAAAGADSAGHTIVAGSGRADVTNDGSTVLVFDVHVTQDSPIGVQAGISVTTSATGRGHEATAELSGQVTDVEVVELD